LQRSRLQTVQELYDAFGRRDLPTVFSLLSPDIEIVQSDELPWGGVYRGHDEARKFFGQLGSHIHSTLDIERLISAGDHVVAIGWTHGTVNATGASYRVPIAHVWVVRDGLAMQAEFFIDHPGMLEALRRDRPDACLTA
jgi:ketosteroid isomerase-like protein